MKKLLDYSLFASSVLATLVGCAFEPDSDSLVETTAQEVQVKEVATVKMGNAQVAFLQIEGETGISIEEEVPLGTVQTPMQQLRGQNATSLEVFMALAPDETPPEELVAAHDMEASALNRDSSIVKATFDSGLIAAASMGPSDCSSAAYNATFPGYEPWTNRGGLSNVTGRNGICIDGAPCQWGYKAPETVTLLAICNADSWRQMAYRVYHRVDPTAGGTPPNPNSWTFITRLVAAGSVKTHINSSTYLHNDRIEGSPGTGQTDLVYHLRTGYAHPN